MVFEQNEYLLRCSSMPHENPAENDVGPSSSSDDAPTDKSSCRLPTPHWFFSLTGHVIAAAVGLGLGYLLLHWLRPEKFPLPW